MSRILAIVLSPVLLLTGLSAQPISYPLQFSGCGQGAQPPSQIPPQVLCAINIDQSTAISHAFVAMSMDLTNNLDNAKRGMQFGSFMGPEGNLGTATYQENQETKLYRIYPLSSEVSSNAHKSTQVTVVTAYIEGYYAPASGGGKFTGYITIHFVYVAQYQQGGTYLWERSVSGGAITID